MTLSRRRAKKGSPKTLKVAKFKDMFFDFDGVILDSVNIKTEAFRKLYEKHGKSIAKKVVAHHLENGGMSRFEKFKLYHKEFLSFQLSQKEIEKLAKEFSNIVYRKVLKAKFIKGSRNFLKKCKTYGKRCFLISATPEREIKKIARKRGLDKYFVDIKGSPESKADNIRKVLRKYKIDKKNALFFGDSPNDKKAADETKVRFIGINYATSKLGYKDFDKLTT